MVSGRSLFELKYQQSTRGLVTLQTLVSLRILNVSDLQKNNDKTPKGSTKAIYAVENLSTPFDCFVYNANRSRGRCWVEHRWFVNFSLLFSVSHPTPHKAFRILYSKLRTLGCLATKRVRVKITSFDSLNFVRQVYLLKFPCYISVINQSITK